MAGQCSGHAGHSQRGCHNVALSIASLRKRLTKPLHRIRRRHGYAEETRRFHERLRSETDSKLSEVCVARTYDTVMHADCSMGMRLQDIVPYGSPSRNLGAYSPIMKARTRKRSSTEVDIAAQRGCCRHEFECGSWWIQTISGSIKQHVVVI